MKQIVIVLFFVVILFLLDLYVFQGFKVLTKKWLSEGTSWANYVYWAVPVVLVGSMLVLAALGSNMSNSAAFRFVVSFVFIIYLVKLCWMVFIVLDDVVRLGRFLSTASDIPNEAMMEKINRSEFIVSAGALVSGTLLGGFVYGILRGAHNYQVMHRKLSFNDLPESFHGLKIVQISDIHSGSFWNREAVKRGVELINQQKADLIFFTGDLVNNHSSEFESYQKVFAEIKAPMGVFSILGNHDYGDYRSWPDQDGMSKEENLKRLINLQEEVGWTLLKNRGVEIKKGNDSIGLIGVENWGAHSGFSKYGDLKRAYEDVKEIPFKLLLSHDPSHWRAQVLEFYQDIKATFSGHTHGMQFGIDTKYYRWSPIKYRYPEWADLYKEKGQYLYVNRGFGYLGYPGRVGFNPEITVFELKRS